MLSAVIAVDQTVSFLFDLFSDDQTSMLGADLIAAVPGMSDEDASTAYEYLGSALTGLSAGASSAVAAGAGAAGTGAGGGGGGAASGGGGGGRSINAFGDEGERAIQDIMKQRGWEQLPSKMGAIGADGVFA